MPIFFWSKMLFLKNSPEAQILDLEITFQLLFLMLLTLVMPVTFPLLLGSIFLSILFHFHQSSLQLTLNYSGCPRIVYYLLPNNPASQPESVTPWGQGAFQFPPPPVDPRTDHFPGHHAWEEAPPSYEATLNPEEQTPATSHSSQQEEREKDTETAPTVVEPLLVEENGSSLVDNMEESHNILVDSTQETDAEETVYLEEDTIETLPPLIEDTGAETTAATTAGPGQESPGRGRGGRRGRRPPARAPQRRQSRPSTRS